MDAKATDLQSEIDRGLYAVHNYEKNRCECMGVSVPLRLTTMTICISYNFRIDLQNIQSKLEDINYAQYLCEKLGDDGLWSINATFGFYNCILVTQRLSNGDKVKKIAIKIFSNGNLHMTGVCSVTQAMLYANAFSELFNILFALTDEDEKYEPDDISVQLINACMKVNKYICLDTLKTNIESNTYYMCSFNNDHHAAVRIKVFCEHHTVNILVFQSGNILFNAFLNGEDLFFSYKFLLDFLTSNNVWKNVGEPLMKKNKPDAEFNYASYLVLK